MGRDSQIAFSIMLFTGGLMILAFAYGMLEAGLIAFCIMTMWYAEWKRAELSDKLNWEKILRREREKKIDDLY